MYNRHFHRMAVVCGLCWLIANADAVGICQIVAKHGKGITLTKAVETAIARHPQVQLEEANVSFARGVVEEAAGAFDWTVQSNILQTRIDTPVTDELRQEYSLAGNIDSEVSNQASIGLGVSKLLPNGILVSPAVTVQRSLDNVLVPGGQNLSTSSVQVTIPLLRGRGNSVTATERAGQAEFEATLEDLEENIAAVAVKVGTSYWAVVEARKTHDITLQAEERGQRYVDSTRALIDADQAPRNDLNEIRANLEQRSSARVAAEQALAVAQYQLALDMGLDSDEVLATTVNASDEFSEEMAHVPADDLEFLRSYTEYAFQHRGAYIAARRRHGRAAILERAARNQLLPRFDLILGTGFIGLQNGRTFFNYLSSPPAGTGPNVTFGLNYTFPVGKTVARGQLAQSVALSKQTDIEAHDTARTISANVAMAVEQVRDAALRVRHARESAQLFQASLEGANEKYRVGLGSIVEILTIEDKLTSQLQDLVSAQEALAISVLQLRYATGSLVESHGRTFSISPEALTTIPIISDSNGERQ